MSRATTGNSNSYSKEALEELRKSTLSTTPVIRNHSADDDLVEEKFPSLLGGKFVPSASIDKHFFDVVGPQED